MYYPNFKKTTICVHTDSYDRYRYRYTDALRQIYNALYTKKKFLFVRNPKSLFMKRLLVLLLPAIAFCFIATADNKTPATGITDLSRLKVGKTTDKEVEAMLGKPINTQTAEYNKYSRWEYRTNEMELKIEWSTKDMTIERFSYHINQSLRAKEDKEWVHTNTAFLVPGKSTWDDVLKLLNTPADIEVNKTTQVVKYNYKNHAVLLSFRKGVLADMTINYLVRKKES